MSYLHSPETNSTSGLTVCLSGDLVPSSRGQTGVWTAVGIVAVRALLEWFPVNSPLCRFRLSDSVHVNISLLERRCLFIVSVHVPSDCASPKSKDAFCRELS